MVERRRCGAVNGARQPLRPLGDAGDFLGVERPARAHLAQPVSQIGVRLLDGERFDVRGIDAPGCQQRRIYPFQLVAQRRLAHEEEAKPVRRAAIDFFHTLQHALELAPIQ